MTYTIELSRIAHKALLKEIPLSEVKKIRNKIEKLKENPNPNGCEKLEGSEDLYRIR